MNSSTISLKRSLRWLERALLLVAVLCLGTWAWAWLDSAYVQYRDNQILDDALNNPSNNPSNNPPATPETPSQAPSLAAETDSLGSFKPQPAAEPPKPPPLEDGSLVGRIEIPRVGVSAIVLEGADTKTLRRGVGHIPETSLPGIGNVGLAAHRDSFFRGLKGIRKNDIIKLQTLNGTFRYRVEWTQIVQPEDTEVLADDGVSELTLVTCYPFNYVGSAPKRFIVRAQEVQEDGGTAPGGGN
jgi:sortase A